MIPEVETKKNVAGRKDIHVHMDPKKPGMFYIDWGSTSILVVNEDEPVYPEKKKRLSFLVTYNQEDSRQIELVDKEIVVSKMHCPKDVSFCSSPYEIEDEYASNPSLLNGMVN